MLFRGRRYPKGTKILKPVWPNAGLEARYRRQLQDMIEEMHNSCVYWLLATYRANEPLTMAHDADDKRKLPAKTAAAAAATASTATASHALRIAVARMAGRWQDRFDEAAPRLAAYFATAVEDRSSQALRKILRDGGWSVKLQMTPAMKEALASAVHQNVGLIKSIPGQYLGEVEQLVMRSAQAGRDVGGLMAQIEARYQVARSRAALIARDQNNKATSALNRARMLDLGIGKAVWLHSHAGKKPRPTHVKMDGRVYDVAEGMWDPAEGEHIHPGWLINCRCTSRPLIEGLS